MKKSLFMLLALALVLTLCVPAGLAVELSDPGVLPLTTEEVTVSMLRSAYMATSCMLGYLGGSEEELDLPR